MHRTMGWMGIAVATSACSGLSLGENRPGGDVYLDDIVVVEDPSTGILAGTGSIGVDPRTDVAYVARRQVDAGVATTTLLAAKVGDTQPSVVADLTGHEDNRITFPAAGLLRFTETGSGGDTLIRHDPETFEVETEFTFEERFHGTRTSPSGRWVAVADGNDEHYDIHVFDPSTLGRVVVPHGGDWVEGMWLNGRDVLVAAVAYDAPRFVGDDELEPSMRLLAWSFEEGSPLDREVVDGVWADPIVDVTIPDTTYHVFGDYTWISVSPDDATVAVPIVDTADETFDAPFGPALAALLDMETGEVRIARDVQGPYGFSPDSSTLVGYRYDPDAPDKGLIPTELSLVDVETLDETRLDLPYQGGVQYHVTREDHLLIVAPLSTNREEPLQLLDFDTGVLTSVAGPTATLSEFVTRPPHRDAILVKHDGIVRVDLETGTSHHALNGLLETFGITPQHVNLLQDDTTLVFDTHAGSHLMFLTDVDDWSQGTGAWMVPLDGTGWSAAR